jgi:hypothetical protein
MRAIGIFAGLALAAVGVLTGQPGLIMAGIGMVISTVVGLLMPKPKAPAQSESGTQLTVRQAAAPHQAIFGRRRVSGVYAFIHSTDTAPGDATPIANQYLHLVVLWAGHEIDAIEEIWFNDEVVPFDAVTGVPTGRYQNYAWAWHHLGAAGQSADAELVASAPSYWTADHRLRGRAYSYIRLKWNRDIFAGSLPNITAVIRGYNQVYDPRDLSTGYSANAALCAAAYLTASFGLGAAYSEIDEDDLIESANVCDEAVSKRAGGTEARYECHYPWTLDRPRGGVLQELLTAMRGEMVFSGGKYRLLAGAWRASALSLGDGDLRGGFRVQTLLSRRDSFNGVKGTFTSEADNWQPVDFPPVSSATYLAQDGDRVWKDVDFPATTSVSACQRIAKIDLLAARQPLTLSGVPFMLKALQVRAGDTIDLTHARFGWSAKTFHVTDLTLALGDMTERGPPLVGVDLSLRESASAVFDWSTSEETTRDPAPNTSLPDVFNPLPPVSLTVVEEMYDTRTASGVKARAVMSWTASPDAFVQSGGAYQPEYRVIGATNWIVLARTVATTVNVDDLNPAQYEFRVAAVNSAGVLSSYLLERREIAGLLAPPAVPANLTISAIGGLALLRWDQSADLDVRVGGSVVFRHQAVLTGATWDAGTGIGEAQPGMTTVAVLPLKSGTYMAKFRDSAGIWSTTAASVVSGQSSVLQYTSIGSVAEDPTFAGTHDATGVDGGVLFLAADYDFDGVADVDALGDWDFSGGVATTGTYTFASGIDLTTVTRCRATSLMTTQVVNVLDQMDDWADVDARADWDGGITGDEADARVWCRVTNDDPAGAPTWGAWNRLDSAEFECRAFQFKTVLSSVDPAYSIRVSALAVTVAEVV